MKNILQATPVLSCAPATNAPSSCEISSLAEPANTVKTSGGGLF
ncbi:uncharacterized protein METZ01_LOCUS107819 [marine metagenome]|uniref:Uncharacterized protein n=1 Tax=marine metagenome TaxID=408172 RepID=A0A381WR41_9ZZZZ